MTEVYAPTTVSNPKSSWFLVPSKFLDKVQFGLKAAEVLLSLVAFVLEELVSSCGNCNPLYFFEFVSCTAFLFTLLLLILLSTRLHEKVGIECWPKLNFFYTVGIAVLLLISSIVFAADNAGSSLESAAEVRISSSDSSSDSSSSSFIHLFFSHPSGVWIPGDPDLCVRRGLLPEDPWVALQSRPGSGCQ
uniref:MARVEL domain-containing protein n=1 Tax=Oryzias latipes TaxID=8090 RepID=A0A3P9I4C6_ORYLA